MRHFIITQRLEERVDKKKISKKHKHCKKREHQRSGHPSTNCAFCGSRVIIGGVLASHTMGSGANDNQYPCGTMIGLD